MIIVLTGKDTFVYINVNNIVFFEAGPIEYGRHQGTDVSMLDGQGVWARETPDEIMHKIRPNT